MSSAIVTLPQAPRFALVSATLPEICLPAPVRAPLGPAREGLLSADIVVSGGKIEAVIPKGAAAGLPGPDLPCADMRDGMVWPAFTDMHTHIDKGHIWERERNPDGTFPGALDAVGRDREANWSAPDLRRRMGFALRSAYAHGTRLLRTHLDSPAPQHRISFDVFAEMRATWKGRIELQGVALFDMLHMDDPAYFRELLDIVSRTGCLMGGVPQMWPDLDDRLDRLFRASAERGLDVDLHVDETEDKEALTLEAIALSKLRTGFPGKVTVGHCCSLARQDSDTAKRVIDRVAEAGLAVVSLPMCNMYLQDRHAGRTPRWRGVTLFSELAAAGVRTAVASDNTRDPFYAYGDLDPVEVFREAVRILHLDHPLDTAARIVTRSPAEILGRPDLGLIAPGGAADLVLFGARRWSEFLSRPQADRIVMRNGMGIDRDLPDYRELDPSGAV